MESSSRRSKRLGAGSKPRPSYVERTSSSSEGRSSSSEDEVDNGAAVGDAAVGDAARAAPGAAVISPATAVAATSSPVSTRGTVSQCFDTPRRKLPSVPPTPICRNCPTPRQTLILHNEIAALKLAISELQAQVAANASAIGALPAPRATPDRIDQRAKKGDAHDKIPFTFPKRTASAQIATSCPPITTSNRFDLLPSEVTELATSSHIAMQVRPISEQWKAYTHKQKVSFEKHMNVSQLASHTPAPSPQPSVSVDKSRVAAIPASEQLQLYARKHSNNFANRVVTPQIAQSTHLSPVSEQSQSHAHKQSSNVTAPSAPCVSPVSRSVVCVSDSMTRSIRNNFLNNKLKQHSVEGSVNETVHMDLNPGGDTEKIKHASKYVIQKHRPNKLIIVAGTNDISHEARAGNADADTIAEKIISIGREAIRDFECVENVAISSIIIRGSAQYSDIVFDVNIRLRLKCIQEDFTYIDNECITKEDLYDGLHLNRFGNEKLLHKLLSCCESYNPCLADNLHY